MHSRRRTRSQVDQRQLRAMDDLFAYAPRQAPQAIDEELWSIKIVRMKTGLSRASVYYYIALGLFPRQRRIGPGRVAWRASDVRTWIASRIFCGSDDQMSR